VLSVAGNCIRISTHGRYSLKTRRRTRAGSFAVGYHARNAWQHEGANQSDGTNRVKLWLVSKWEELRGTFWFLPTLMVAAAISLSLLTTSLDLATADHNWIATLGWTFTRGPEGSRALLATVAGSMMTIASVTFSITIVALQLASSQFGPRLLRNFMRDRGNQIAIGTFIATFTYCLLILRTVNGTEHEQFVPHISVSVALTLSLLSVGVWIYFIHHSAESIQAENVIAAVSRELQHAIERLYPQCLGEELPAPLLEQGQPQLPNSFDEEARAVSVTVSNYLQAIDIDRLLELSTERDLVLAIDRRPGKFYFQGDDLARVWPAERVDEDVINAVRGSFYFGYRRTLVQDVEFAIDQLVEVAVRALSPGVNDPFTAINCVDRLGAALCGLAERSIPSPYRYDKEGHLRVVTDASTIRGMVDASFDQIRQAAHGTTSVTLRLLETIAAVAAHTRNPAFRTALRHQADAIQRGSESSIKDPTDRQDVEVRYREAIQSIENPRAGAARAPASP
jgi:uncharacterized membrane protein